MGALTGIAIILVVLGHLDMNELSVFGLFPYYSFHVQIFLFISGYFYNEDDEDGIGRYFLRKARRLLLPYYICNLAYGILSTILAGRGFTYCQPITLYNFIIEPWLGGHQYGLNFAAWFVPALFLVEMINILARKLWNSIAGLLCKPRDTENTDLKRKRTTLLNVLAFSTALICGVVTVVLAQTGHVWGYYKTPGRILIMLPMYEFGILYRTVLEKYEKRLPDAAALLATGGIQFIAYIAAYGSLNYSIVWCTSFAGMPMIPFVTAICGTWFWLRIAGLLSDSRIGSFLDNTGRHSFRIMMHHIAVFWVINLVTMLICNAMQPEIAFDAEAFKTNINYVYQVRGLYAWRLVYLGVTWAFLTLGTESKCHSRCMIKV